MKTRKFQKCTSVRFIILFVVVTLPLACGMVHSKESSYKHTEQTKGFKQGDLPQSQVDLRQALDKLKEKSDNLEARVNKLASAKDKQIRAHAQMRMKVSNLEKEHAKLKEKVASLEIANKKSYNRVSMAKAPQKTKPIVPKKPGTKVTQKKMVTMNKSATKATTTKSSLSKDTETTPALPSYSPKVTEGEKPEEERDVKIDGLDLKKINEKGIEYGRKGMYDAAIKEFQKVAAAEPNLANAHYNLGLAYKKKGMQPDADREFAEYERLKGRNN